jgi:hypothetical protein
VFIDEILANMTQVSDVAPGPLVQNDEGVYESRSVVVFRCLKISFSLLLRLFRTVTSGGSRNFEKGEGGHSRKGGPPLKIAKN